MIEAIKTMRVGEEANFIIDEEAALASLPGPRSLSQPDKLTAKVRLISANPSPGRAPGKAAHESDEDVINLWKMTTGQKIALAARMRETGNYWTEKQEYQKAISWYTQALGALDKVFDVDPEGEDIEPVKKLRLPCLLNAAHVCLKMEQYQDVIAHTSTALKLDGDNVKALYRRAKGYIGQREYSKALKDILHGLKVEPKNRALRELYEPVSQHVAKQRDKERKMASVMFHGPPSPELRKRNGAAGIGGGLYDDKPDNRQLSTFEEWRQWAKSSHRLRIVQWLLTFFYAPLGILLAFIRNPHGFVYGQVKTWLGWPFRIARWSYKCCRYPMRMCRRLFGAGKGNAEKVENRQAAAGS